MLYSPMSYYSDDDRMHEWLVNKIRLPCHVNWHGWELGELDYWIAVYRLLHYGFEVLARWDEP